MAKRKARAEALARLLKAHERCCTCASEAGVYHGIRTSPERDTPEMYQKQHNWHAQHDKAEQEFASALRAYVRAIRQSRPTGETK